jgi:hypothetical protein
MLLLHDGFTLLNAEMNDKQLIKYTFLKKPMLLSQPERSEIKQAACTDFYTTQFF